MELKLLVMSKFIYLFLFLICFQPNEESILWDENHRLEWSDFKGNPNLNSGAVAITASGLTFDFSARTTSTRLVDFTATVEAYFYPSQSWYIKEGANNIVLAHEQLHFDITELHARKLRKQIDEASFSINIKKEISKLHTKINKELKAFQNKYDSESDYSRSIETQKKWQIFVKQELKKLSNYK